MTQSWVGFFTLSEKKNRERIKNLIKIKWQRNKKKTKWIKDKITKGIYFLFYLLSLKIFEEYLIFFRNSSQRKNEKNNSKYEYTRCVKVKLFEKLIKLL